ncbi:hypothetical protein MIR68_011855 [Amoeboaphelidium protococcarum]|nr:hypothetical protein MIR68_011855 [Amoeboaphelidium protococcarum]
MATPMLQDTCWTLIGGIEQDSDATAKNLKSALESKSESVKIDAMKSLVVITMQGSDTQLAGDMMMYVIRFVLPSKNKTLKKLLLVYWEVCPKKNPDGKLKQEMILVCNYLRNDLQSPNEYVRAATLRLLCKLRETDLLEPLVPSVRQCLEHRSSLVRKNAVVSIMSIFKYNETLIPDAGEIVQAYLMQEVDANCRRNAFLALTSIDHHRALVYLMSLLDRVDQFDDHMQLAIVELIKRDTTGNPEARSSYIKAILTLLECTQSAAVKFEASGTLMMLTQSPAAVTAVGKCYAELATKESDNNVKLIVLDRLAEIKTKYDRVLDDLAIDVLRVLSSPDIEVCKKAVSVALDLLSTKNIREVVSFLQKEIQKTRDPNAKDKSAEYRQLLIHAIHQCALRFPEGSAEVVHVLMEYLGDSNTNAALDVISFIREVMEKNSDMRHEILVKLFENFKDMKNGKVLRGALWVIGEYCNDQMLIESAFGVIRDSIGKLPILESERLAAEEVLMNDLSNENDGSQQVNGADMKPVTKTKVLADGTYATETTYSHVSPTTLQNTVAGLSKPQLRALILEGDYFLAGVLGVSMVKLIFRLAQTSGADMNLTNSLKALSMLIITSVIRVGQSSIVSAQIDDDSYGRLLSCLKMLCNSQAVSKMNVILLKHSHEVFAKLMQVNEGKKKMAQLSLNLSSGAGGVGLSSQSAASQNLEQLVMFRQIKTKTGANAIASAYEQDIAKATGSSDIKGVGSNKLNRVVQLTGYSDTVYAEAYVDVHQYDILLDVLLVNQTTATLQNLTIEFSTLGDLKIVERPTAINLGAHGFHSIKANIKVSSTETGVIFGNIVYDQKGSSDSTVILLKDIHVDIMDYIRPAECTNNEFRSMWTEFEWENKININTNITDIHEYLKHVLKCTNMKCLTPEKALAGSCGFLSANLYARSLFGEDALANISMEQNPVDKTIRGSIRIRSRTQGIALSLGDKITLTQKKALTAEE